ncbi:MAG: branched-chain amino acid ABC transporter permease [Desulfomonile tiedjei]|uniref:Branched-chain amino acid ABC transporter permease n=1 Tax=Desulfomonile tiedjei TaxID=2358 RepID=A0A9D6V6L3_9BACT|nr:branched-chain amino acid ABC transporter permease [Desulfomonile tiedjei]
MEIIINGLSTGAIYALLALGFVLIFKSTGILNFAQGELCMVGAFFCYTFATLLGLPYVAAFLIAIILGGLLGAVIDFLFFRRLVGEPIFSTIMVTVGLASVITSGAGLIWGHDVYSITAPFTDKTFVLGGVVLGRGALYTIGISILLFIVFVLFFNRSLLGVSMRGTSEDPHTAGLMGINVKKIHMLAWAIGSAVAVVAGIFLADQSFVRLPMSHTGIKAMSAAILGGMDSIKGAIVGGAIIGLVEGFAANYLSGMVVGGFHFGDVKDVTAFSIMILVLMIKPHGIFGKEKVERV